MAPDWMLGVLMGVGGMIGMYAGARTQKFIPAKLIKWILAFILTGGRYILSFWFNRIQEIQTLVSLCF